MSSASRLAQALAGMVVAAVLLSASGASAQATGSAASRATATLNPLRPNPQWRSLSGAQRSALAPLERDWPTIPAGRKQKWLEVAARFPQMAPDERQRIQGRMNDWARLSPKERGEARLHYQELRQLSAAERQARWEKYQSLSADQRRELAARAQPASAPDRGQSAHAPRPASAPVQKSNLVSAQPPVLAVRPVAPTVVQARPGATTTLMSNRPAPPAHQQPGLPKVAATPGFVDRNTLLPQKGAQAAGTRPAPPASAAPKP